MQNKPEKILVIDLEATCWQGPAPVGQKQEIIEIGLCFLNLRTREPEGKRSILVRPTRSEISDFCTELTTITPEMVANAPLFPEAMEILEHEIGARQFTWGTYGSWDPWQIRKQCEWDGIEYPMSEAHINVKTFAAEQLNLRRKTGMKGMLRKLQIPLTGTHHRGHDDAENIAKILARVYV